MKLNGRVGNRHGPKYLYLDFVKHLLLCNRWCNQIDNVKRLGFGVDIGVCHAFLHDRFGLRSLHHLFSNLTKLDDNSMLRMKIDVQNAPWRAKITLVGTLTEPSANTTATWSSSQSSVDSSQKRNS